MASGSMPLRASSPPLGMGPEERESLGTHRARLQAARPKLLSQTEQRPAGKGAQGDKPAVLSLVNPSFSKDAENHGDVKEVEDAKKFKAFRGSGNVLLSADQIKTASSSQMHRLAVARLARLNRQSQQSPADTDNTEAASEVDQATTEAEAKAFTAAHFANPVERTQKLLAEAATMAAVQSVAALETLEGVTQGEDEFGKTWEHSWVINPETKSRREYRSGRDSEGKTWQESSMLLEDGTYVSKGSNSDGHHWGEKAGKFANGTSWREKWLEKPEAEWYEKTTWWSDGTVLGERGSSRANVESGEGWSERWRQVLRDGIEIGSLAGSNQEGDTWEEEWETAALHALNSETGERLFSTCGQKSGVTADGKVWSETWGKDDLFGTWGTKTEEHANGEKLQEQWGRNLEGDIWVEKWGVHKCELGVEEEWGWKCGEKVVHAGEEMDGVTKREDGVCTWTEQWTKTFEVSRKP